MRTCCSAFSKKRVLIVISVVVLVFISIDLLLLFNQRKPVFRMEPPDAEIKLLGIEPDNSGIIFDPKGKKIYDNIITGAEYRSSTDNLTRTFIFEVLNLTEKGLNPTEEVHYSPNLIVKKTGENKSTLSSRILNTVSPLVEQNNHLYFSISIQVPKTEKNKLFWGLWTTKIKIKYIDVTFKYYDRRGAAEYTFEGPFFTGRT